MEDGRVVKALMNRDVLKILLSIYWKSKSAVEISEECSIPRSSCYRKLKELEKLGLVEPAEKLLNSRGRYYWKYRSSIHSMHITLEKGRLRVRITYPYMSPIVLERDYHSL